MKIKKKLYPNRKLKSTTPYKGDVIHGTVVEFRQDGSISKETPYENGKLHGVKKLYFTNGNLSYEYPYVKGVIMGEVKEYERDGSISMETDYKNDLPNGLERYYQNGNLLRETTYKHGEKDGVVNYYYPSGKIKIQFSFINGIIGDSTITHFSEDGEITEEFKSEIKSFEPKKPDGFTTYKCYAYKRVPGEDWKIYSRCRPVENNMYKCGYFSKDFFL